MRVTTAVKYIIIFLFIVVFGVLAGAGYQLYVSRFTNRFTIAPSRIIKNEARLKEYLGAGGNFPLKSLVIIPQNIWRKTTDCIAEARDKDRIFCLEEFVDSGKMTINIYPNQDQIALTKPETADRLLNLLIISIFETRFGLDPKAKNLILDKGNGGYLFKW